MKATMRKSETVRTTTVTPEGTTERVQVTTTLDVEDGPILETGYNQLRRYRVERIIIRLDRHGVTFTTRGQSIRKDGTPGATKRHDVFHKDGRRLYWAHRGPAPAEIVEEVQRWA